MLTIFLTFSYTCQCTSRHISLRVPIINIVIINYVSLFTSLNLHHDPDYGCNNGHHVMSSARPVGVDSFRWSTCSSRYIKLFLKWVLSDIIKSKWIRFWWGFVPLSMIQMYVIVYTGAWDIDCQHVFTLINFLICLH